MPFVHLVKFSVDHGHEQSWAILLISLIDVGSMSGRLTLGGLADRFGRHRSVVTMFLGMASVQAWWYLSTSFWALAIFAVLFGLFYGGYVALTPALAAGFIFDVTQTYDLPIALSASTGFLSVAVILMLPPPDRWREV